MKNLMNKIRKSNKGFTLVELIIAIAIIAVLTAVAAPQYVKWVDKSRWAQDKNNAQILLTAVQTAVADPDYTIADGSTAELTTGGITPAASASGTGLAKYFADTGLDTSGVKITNKGTAAKAEEGATAKYGKYTVTVSGNTVTGAWSNPTT